MCEFFVELFGNLMHRILFGCAQFSHVQTQTNYSQQKGFQEINQLKNECKAKVIRSGEKMQMQIQSTKMAVGSILSLKEGNRVAVDRFYLRGHLLTANTSQETEESIIVSMSESFPFVPSDSAVESSDEHALMAAIGPNSQSGSHIVDIQQMADENKKSSLEKKFDKVAMLLTWIECVVEL
jgi:magnesium-transporting ATPase (P-type)